VLSITRGNHRISAMSTWSRWWYHSTGEGLSLRSKRGKPLWCRLLHRIYSI